MEIKILLLFWINFGIGLADILDCNQVYGFNFPTVCRITTGTIGNDEELKISNTFSNITTLTFTNVNFEKIPKNIFTLYPKVATFFITVNNLNQLTSADFTNAKNLKTLYFISNELTTIPSKVFEQCSVLDSLSITLNPIQEIQERAFYGLNVLKILTLSDQPLKNFQPSVLKDLPSLQTLRMDNCSLTSITSDFFTENPRMTSINFNGNSIEYVEAGSFLKMPNISMVDLSGNKLVSFSTENIPHATIYKNLLRQLHIGSQTVTVSAEGNFISNLTVEENSSLRYLILGNNSLSKLSFLKKMPNLIDLQLEKNKFGKLNRNIFSNLINVTRFKIDGNPKLKLTSKMVSFMPKLLRLEIDSFVNGYKNLNTSFPKLFSVSLNTKNWNCDRVKKVAAVLNSQRMYLFVKYYGSEELDKAVCNMTSYDVNKF